MNHLGKGKRERRASEMSERRRIAISNTIRREGRAGRREPIKASRSAKGADAQRNEVSSAKRADEIDSELRERMQQEREERGRGL